MNESWPKVYAVKHKDEEIRASSRSGGMFSALSDYVLEMDGAIYGCVLTKDFQAVHVRADRKETRDKMRGSKYIQSRLGETYKEVKIDLEEGREVLFSGTSCQVAGLKAFLGKKYETLFCVDIVCHGVPSPYVWKRYLEWQEKKAGSKAKEVSFRNKKDFGWRAHVETLVMENEKRVNSAVFAALFYGHNILRPSCYECPYKSTAHPGDMTIADYWGIDKAAPEFSDDLGISLVFINCDKGMEYFEAVKERLTWKCTKMEDSMQQPLIAPYPKPDTRDRFWHDFRNKDFEYIARIYGRKSLMSKMKKKLASVKRKLMCGKQAAL